MGARERRGVVDPVPDERDARARVVEVIHDARLILGEKLRIEAIKSELGCHPSGAIMAVACQQQYLSCAEASQELDGGGSIVAQGVSQANDAQQPAAEADAEHCLAFVEEPVDDIPMP